MTWAKFASRRHAPLSARLLQEAQRPPFFESATTIRGGLHNHAWVGDSIYIPSDEQAALASEVEAELGDDWSLVDRFCVRCESSLVALTAAADAFVVEAAGGTGPALTSWFDAYRHTTAFVPAFRILDRVLGAHVTPVEAEAYLSESGAGNTVEGAERRELEALVDQLREAGDRTATSPLADRLLQAHADGYAWLRPRWYLGEPFTVDDFRGRAAGLLRLPSTPPVSVPVEKDTPESSPRSALLGRLAHLRTSRAEIINRAIWTVRPTLTALAHDLGATYLQLVHLVPDELVAAAESGRLDVSRADRRRELFATVLVADSFIDAAGADEVDDVVGRLGLRDDQPEGPPATGSLTGVAASPGTASGQVRVVRTDEDIAAVQVGEVLVTTMTYPSMVGAMQRAAAIVTDDGGLLSHAAVTARELGKPCVIETLHATRVLHTGQWVRVDADAATITEITPSPIEGAGP